MAENLFKICDQEEKGFVTKRDMQRLRLDGSTPLGPEDLEQVFDALDSDKNGYLTLEEFTNGFSTFAEDVSQKERDESDDVFVEEKLINPTNDKQKLAAETFSTSVDDQFESLLDDLGVRSVIGEDLTQLKSMWNHLMMNPDPEVIGNFEQVLTKLSSGLNKKSEEQETLEVKLKSKQKMEENRLVEMLEEMEGQLAKERDDIRREEKQRGEMERRKLESELDEKDSTLRSLTQKQRSVEEKLREMEDQIVPCIKDENMQLLKERESMLTELEHHKILVQDMRDQLDELRRNEKVEKRDRAKAALKITENIAMERENLVLELDNLRNYKTRVMDDCDTNLATGNKENNGIHKLGKRLASLQTPNSEKEVPSSVTDFHSLKPLTPEEERDVLMDASQGEESLRRMRHFPPILHRGQKIEGQEEGRARPPLLRARSQSSMKRSRRLSSKASSDNISLFDELAETMSLSTPEDDAEGVLPLPDNEADLLKTQILEIAEDDLNSIDGCYEASTDNDMSFSNNQEGQRATFISTSAIHNSEKKVGKRAAFEDINLSSINESDYSLESTNFSNESENSIDKTSKEFQIFGTQTKVVAKNPDRMFKVIFIGDSSVGKSSIVSRFCDESYDSNRTATLGVDFRNRLLMVEGVSVCLQCWDTAGQERFKSITRQYFRKSDAVVVVYDLTSERSFLNAREWIEDAKQSLGEGSQGVLFTLMGNKLDLVTDDTRRQIRETDGLKLAEGVGSQFCEVSAAADINVESCLREMAKRLLENQDLELQKIADEGQNPICLSEKDKKRKKCKTC